MRNVSVYVSNVILVIATLFLVFIPFGCNFSQPGETVAEGSRRHQRTIRINQQEMMSDIDATLLLDRPSRLDDRRIP
jgi:hypothetical protein